MSPPRSKKRELTGAENPPQPAIVISGERPSTIRDLLIELNHKPLPESGNVVGTPAEKRKIRTYLELNSKSPRVKVHPVLIRQLRLRRWIDDDEVDELYLRIEQDVAAADC